MRHVYIKPGSPQLNGKVERCIPSGLGLLLKGVPGVGELMYGMFTGDFDWEMILADTVTQMFAGPCGFVGPWGLAKSIGYNVTGTIQSVTDPIITRKYNKIVWAKLNQKAAVLESGIISGLNRAVTDVVKVPDINSANSK